MGVHGCSVDVDFRYKHLAAVSLMPHIPSVPTETRPATLSPDITDDLRALGARLARSGHARVVPERFDLIEGKAILAGYDDAKRNM